MTEAEKIEMLAKKLAEFGGSWRELPILMPAETILEMAGETLRPRLYFTQSPDGRELCLRPDLTIPAALQYIENDDAISQKYLCSGKVFRADGTGNINAHEINQLGIEYFGDEDLLNAEFSVLKSVYEACKGVSDAPFYFEFSDASLISKIIQSANIDKVWKGYLLDVAGEINELLMRLDFAVLTEKPAPSALAKSMIEIWENEAIASVDEILGIAKLKTHNSRNAKDIALRMRQKAKRALAPPLNTEFAETLKAIINVKNRPLTAISQITRLGEKIGVDLGDWEKSQSEKFAKLFQIGREIDENGVFVGAKAGRFEYYDGFTFDIHFTECADRPFVSGGRYDGLVSVLSNGIKTSRAIGAVIRAKRI